MPRVTGAARPTSAVVLTVRLASYIHVSRLLSIGLALEVEVKDRLSKMTKMKTHYSCDSM